MLNDPQSVTINGAAVSLPATKQTGETRTYRSMDGEFALDVKQYTSKARQRREFRLTQTKIAADPLTAINQEVSASIIITVDEPKSGFSDTELGYLIDGLKAAFGSSTYSKVLGGEM